jgi:hypothetical protein
MYDNYSKHKARMIKFIFLATLKHKTRNFRMRVS